MSCPLCDAGFTPKERVITNCLVFPKRIVPKGNRRERSFAKHCWKMKHKNEDIKLQQFILHIERQYGLIW